ncbi:tRNA (adenosine(37)-N6)-threonylcarbamoyltransferase complex ATPase subunit type 1 TsaE [Fulvimarina endophytica]|uniref:tRNA threonylcarbamoyladenosine biosynthesis protein TsaE n=2 Tax=Fulvimarina endophytica TaxID=2293836 RepID=A0A371XBX6_9HYPH|nr:tRNA (adenosine(37)-N6)-threonylcarbamoyltransferase complex ATPase subunit type 1 TsaE [Fulvimarina endophytica]
MTTPDLTVIEIIELMDSAATERLGRDLSLVLAKGDAVMLLGDLGAGKSTLARAMIRAVAGDDGLDVPSPTFTLVQAYGGRVPVSHFDLYRLGDENEIGELGFDDALEEGAAIVEWPQRVPSVLARADIVIELRMSENGGRCAAIAARGSAVRRLSRTRSIRAFLARSGLAESERRHLNGDASSRRYETVSGPAGTLILMDSPRQPDGPPIRDGLPYSQLVHLAEDVGPFVAISSALATAGFTAPRIVASDLEEGLLLITNLGGATILKRDGDPDPERYHAAIDCLSKLHRMDWASGLPVGEGRIHHVSAYDRRAMMIEAELLPDWFVSDTLGRAVDVEELALFREAWNMAFDEIETAERTLVLRDFHSPNIIWQPDAIGISRIGIIDFQDAMIGPTAYDVASLAQDARVTIPAELEASLVAAYIASRRKSDPEFKPFYFERDYAVMAAQRATKILGIFVRLANRDGKPQYKRHIPRIIEYLRRSLDHPTLAPVKSLYSDWGIVEKH